MPTPIRDRLGIRRYPTTIVVDADESASRRRSVTILNQLDEFLEAVEEGQAKAKAARE